MHEMTSAIRDLRMVAASLDHSGHHDIVDEIDNLLVNIVLAQQKRQKTELTPLGKALAYGVPAFFAGQAFLNHITPDSDPKITQNNKPAISAPSRTLNIDVNPIDRSKVNNQFDIPDIDPAWYKDKAQSPVVPQKRVTKKPAPRKGDFSKFKEFTLPAEGGYVHRSKAADPGGATNMGVTQRTYNTWRDSKNLPRQSVRKITPAEAKQIMMEMYWEPIKAHRLPERTAIAVADMSYHSGPRKAIITLQKALGLTPDGSIGPETLQKAWEFATTPQRDQELAIKITNLREQELRTKPHAPANPGWFKRTDKLRDYVSDPEEFPSQK